MEINWDNGISEYLNDDDYIKEELRKICTKLYLQQKTWYGKRWYKITIPDKIENLPLEKVHESKTEDIVEFWN